MEWLDADGNRMNDYTWFNPQERLVQMLRSGRGVDRDALVIINGQDNSERVIIPWGRGKSFDLVWASQWERPRDSFDSYEPGESLIMAPFSMAILLS